MFVHTHRKMTVHSRPPPRPRPPCKFDKGCRFGEPAAGGQEPLSPAPVGRPASFPFPPAAKRPPFHILSASSRPRAATAHPARRRTTVPRRSSPPRSSNPTARGRQGGRPAAHSPRSPLQGPHFRPRRGRTGPGRHLARSAWVPPAQSPHGSGRAPSPARLRSARAAAASPTCSRATWGSPERR